MSLNMLNGGPNNRRSRNKIPSNKSFIGFDLDMNKVRKQENNTKNTTDVTINGITINQKNNTTQINNTRINNTIRSNQNVKKHYFIGAKLNKSVSKNLEKIKQSVPRNLIHHEQKTYHTRFVYLGYLSDEDAEKFVGYLNPAFIALAKKFRELQCDFTEFESRKKSGYKKISIGYNSNVVKNIIVPYLRNYVNEILNYNSSTRYEPHVNLFTSKEQFDVTRMKNNMIPEYFKINSIDVLAGTPVQKRSGTPSKNDTMNMEIFRSIPFVGKISNKNISNNS
jgi:hypothetical protein